MAKNNDILNFSYSIFTADWDKFKARASKHPNIGFGENEKDENGSYDYAYLKKEKVFLAKYYMDDMEISTDITKANFFKYIRGANIDIYSTVMESLEKDFKYVLTMENHAGVDYPYEVVKGRQNALKCVSDMNESVGKNVMKFELYKSFVERLTMQPSEHNMMILETLNDVNELYDILTENKIDSEDALKKYVNDRLKQKFGEKFDQSIADKIFNGLKEKYKDNYGAAVGALR